jgi:3-isopropylmalate/(R)-2-methylmalate dehydratase large subunit
VVGTDSHLNIMGAIGAFGQGMGDQDIAFGFKAGKTWFEVPETIKIEVVGDLPQNTTPKDLTLAIVGRLGTSGALGKAVEFYGDAIDRLSLPGRITLASMATEMGAIIGLVPPSMPVLEQCREFAGNRKFEPQYADDGAKYVQELKIDISDLTPQVATPPKPDSVVGVEKLKEVKVDSVFIGSCTNGTYEDIKLVSQIAEGRKTAPGVMAKIVPATRKVFTRLLKEGLIEILHDSGFIISNPGCGGCASGQIGMTGKGEVQVSTSNRNFTGKQGAGDTYLASPAVAAASAILGRIGTVEELGDD